MSELQPNEVRAAAVVLKLKLEEIETGPAKGLESAFQTAKQKQVDAIMTFIGNRFFAGRKRIVELAGKYQFPAIYFQKEYVDEGGLMSYRMDYTDQLPSVYVNREAVDAGWFMYTGRTSRTATGASPPMWTKS